MDPNTPTAAAEWSAILEAAYQAWEQGDTLAAWVTRYPAYAEKLTALALSRARQQTDPSPPPSAVAHAAQALTAAQDAALGPPDAEEAVSPPPTPRTPSA